MIAKPLKSKPVEVKLQWKEIVKEGKKRPCLIYQDCILEKPEKLRFITFRNNFCSFITIQAKSSNDGNLFTVVPKLQLMQDAHYENDAQNWHRIDVQNTFKKKSPIDDQKYSHL